MRLTLALYFGSLSCGVAFLPWIERGKTHRRIRGCNSLATKLLLAGGPGWKNDNFLDSLGGDDDDMQDAEQDYQEFRESRDAFNKRQEERMNTPAGRKFLDQMERRAPPPELDEEEEGDGLVVFGDMPAAGSSGREPSRFRRMMEQSKQISRGAIRTPFVEQKLAIPLDDDEEEKGDKSEKTEV